MNAELCLPGQEEEEMGGYEEGRGRRRREIEKDNR
jgi:hypothetical protein